ncbi:MAG TPA: Re/Si-specific NAD(P)(+) transhydrogenase subunit alpha [Candidatus Acidoferrales bacterium]|nr:Re/Si-specific NAD(P)(+) transhydrogenase subunit alpha [Candidatus Acidoferrales bacterium]
MKIAVPRERAAGERRVALVPETVAKYIKNGIAVAVEHEAGRSAGFSDEAYSRAGATIAAAPADLYADADVVVRVAKPGDAELSGIKPGTTLVGFLSPLGDPASVERYAALGLTALSMDAIPRTTKAQAMDALSSQSNIAGYKAALLAAEYLPRFFPMLTTAAGTIPPAKVLVIGAGVAGLQAIATARRLGAVVSAYDTRAVVKEQIQSLGAKFLQFDLGVDAQAAGGYAKELTPEQTHKQRELMKNAIAASDAVVTTAAVPGRRAPIIITADAVAAMTPGSVIVDIAAETGGNCELTKPGETITSANGVTVIGALNLAATVATHASQLYSRNVQTLLDYLIKDGTLNLDMNDEIVRGTTIVRAGEIVHEATLAARTVTS